MIDASTPAIATRTVEYAEGLVERCRSAVSTPRGTESATESTDATDGERADPFGSDQTADDEPSERELLEPTQRIERLLDANGGRLWQRELVEESGRSSSTVSRWLCDLEERGAIVRVTVGREKLVALPEHGFDCLGSELDRIASAD